MSSYIFVSIYIALSFFYEYHFFASIQLNGYKLSKILDRNNKKLIRFIMYNLFNSLVLFGINLILFNINNQFIFFVDIIYLLLFILLIIKNKNNFIKTPLKITNRVIRLFIINSILKIILFSLLIYYFCIYINLLLPIFSLLNFLVFIIGFYLILPFEKINNYRYILNAKKRFSNKNIIKIAVTGSYGKTSVKHILTHILSSKYNTLTTEKNYNTELGLAISSKNINKKTEIFVAEFGAKNKGDITRLCKICKPDIAIITGICNQHLESFKSIENIIKTKSEILEYSDTTFFNGNNKFAKEIYNNYKKNKEITFSDTCYAEDIKYSSSVMTQHSYQKV